MSFFLTFSRIYKSLGCPQSCGDGVRGTNGENLRQKGQNCLQRLQRGNPSLFRKYLRDSVRRHSIQDSVDFMHSILGFCIESGSVVQSPTGKLFTYLLLFVLVFYIDVIQNKFKMNEIFDCLDCFKGLRMFSPLTMVWCNGHEFELVITLV